jgi:hypothetical protein
MNIFEAISNPFRKKKDAGVAVVSVPSKHNSIENESMTRSDKMNWFLEAYKSVPLVSAIINVQSDQVVQDFYFEGSNKEKIEKWADDVNLMDFFYRMTKNMLLFGNAYSEVVKKGDTITKLKVLNPIWIDVYRNPQGKVTGYSQIINNEKLILWGSTGNTEQDAKFKKRVRVMDHIVHFKYNCIGSEKYGLSALESLKESIMSKVNMEADVGKILNKYVAPLIWAKVGTDEFPAQEAVVTETAETIRDLSAESEIATSHLVDLSVLGFDSKGMDIKTPLSHVEQQIISGGQVPPILLGRMEGSTDKGADVQLRNFGRHIKSIQRELKISFEDEILVKQGLGNPDDKLVWTKAEEKEWETDTDILRGLVTDGILTAQKANDLLPPKFREKLPEKPDLLNQQAVGPGGLQQPRPTQRKDGTKVTDNPNDPTQTTKLDRAKGKRVKRDDRAIPAKDGK